jgi:hypothetical protein
MAYRKRKRNDGENINMAEKVGVSVWQLKMSAAMAARESYVANGSGKVMAAGISVMA